MFPHVRQQVYANARVLTDLGFIQAAKSPWLFRFPLPGGGVIFANFGSTEEVPIWESTAALIHWQLEEHNSEIESALVEGILSRCRAAGADVRVSFYNQRFDL